MQAELKPWYAVATPHEDIREGRLEEAVFAANLWAVVQGTAREVYGDPEQFYAKSYMTAGLAAVLKRVASGLLGRADAGDRIIGLQTAFGGGKTHTLVALYHLARNGATLKASQSGAELRELLGDRFPESVRSWAVFTNTSCDATQGRLTSDGFRVRTIWGDIAYQLGGAELYGLVRANDETQRVPQGLFVDVLRAAAPCLILLDELADYCVGAAAVAVGDTTLADQTISFVQQLEEAVSQVPGAVVVATLPASRLEVAQSEKSQELFSALEKRFQRLGADVKPVADDEIYEVVRARLFEQVAPPDAPDHPKQVAEAYQRLYEAHSGEVPADAARGTYREQIRRSYPFHPLLIDALYTRWGSHPDFQRTRGVLRLLASVVGDLWQRRAGNTETQHLIQPCHVRWSIDALQAALTRLWGAQYQSVAAADVEGDRANATMFDEERGGDYRREGIGRGLASAALLGSFGGQGERSGFSSRDLKIACARQGVNWNYVDGALMELEQRCFYLHDVAGAGAGKRYWFSSRPTLNKLVVQYRQQCAGKDFDAEILEALKLQCQDPASAGATWRVVVSPEAELPEQKMLSLLVLPPAHVWPEDECGRQSVRAAVTALSAKCGSKDRVYRNTLLFLAPSPRGLARLRQAHLECAALEGVRRDYGAQLDDDQKAELRTKTEAALTAAKAALGPAYVVALRVSGQQVEECTLSDARSTFKDHLGYLWSTLVEDEEWVLRRVGSVMLQKTGLVPEDGALRLRDAVEAFLKYTDKPMVATKSAVTEGLSQACKDGIVGIGRGASPSTLQAKYIKQSVSLDPSEEGLWILPPFMPETVPEREPKEDDFTLVTPGEAPKPPAVPPGGGAQVPPTGATTGSGVSSQSTVKRVRVKGAVSVENYSELFRCFVAPATRMNLKKLRLGIEFDLEPSETSPLDADDNALKAMKEAARQLGLELEAEDS